MQVLIENGIAFIIAFQSLAGSWLIAPMQFFSFLGNEEFFLLILPLIYWSIDSALGLQVGLILMTSNLFNYAAKLIFASPRPYWLSSHVRALWLNETSFGIPSGHAQIAASVWGMVAVYYKRFWVWAVALTVIFLIGVSRVFLGAHFPHDVVFGWLLGAAILWAFAYLGQPVGAWLGKKKTSQQVLIAFTGSLLFIALGGGSWSLRRAYQVPETWISGALLAGAHLPDPVDLSGVFTSAGTLFGLAAGAAWSISTAGIRFRAELRACRKTQFQSAPCAMPSA